MTTIKESDDALKVIHEAGRTPPRDSLLSCDTEGCTGTVWDIDPDYVRQRMHSVSTETPYRCDGCGQQDFRLVTARG